MKSIITAAIIAISFISTSQTQGDISHNSFVSNFNHDPNACGSTYDIGHFVNISNSFLDDSIRVIDFGGSVMYMELNTTGTPNWNVMLPFPDFGVASDQQVSGGMLNSFQPANFFKIIVGGDTLYNIQGTVINEPVSNACTYNAVSGQVYIDNDGNCNYSGTDSPISSLSIAPSVNFSNAPMFSTQNGFTNGTGNYSMTIQESWMTDYTISVPSTYQFIFPNSTCTPLSYNFTTLPQSNVDFVLECADLDTWVGMPVASNVHAALPFNLHPYVSNIGCDAVSGLLKLVLNSDVTYNAVNSSNPADYIDGDTLFWNYSNLNNISGGAYWNSFMGGIELTPVPSVVTGDILCFELITAVPMNDINSSNNSTNICVPVVAAYDPNIKTVEPAGLGAEGFIPVATAKLKYTIHFQNTGTAQAINIHVDDTLEQNILPNTLKILSSSHTMIPVWLDNDVIRFNYNNINLPDSTTNEPDSHGFVEFEIDMQQGLAEGTEIQNRAYIYFDNNPAVITDYALNTIEYLSGISELESSDYTLYPNPTNGMCTVVSNETIESIEIRDNNGRVLDTFTSNMIDLSLYSNGVYFVKVTTANSSTVKRVVKQ